MSQLLQVATRATGNFVITTAAPTHYDQGLPFNGSALCYVQNGAVDHHHQGIPFTADGRLAATLGGAPVYNGPGGLPLTSAGRIAFGTGVVNRVNSGIPYTAANQLKV